MFATNILEMIDPRNFTDECLIEILEFIIRRPIGQSETVFIYMALLFKCLIGAASNKSSRGGRSDRGAGGRGGRGGRGAGAGGRSGRGAGGRAWGGGFSETPSINTINTDLFNSNYTEDDEGLSWNEIKPLIVGTKHILQKYDQLSETLRKIYIQKISKKIALDSKKDIPTETATTIVNAIINPTNTVPYYSLLSNEELAAAGISRNQLNAVMRQGTGVRTFAPIGLAYGGKRRKARHSTHKRRRPLRTKRHVTHKRRT
jgi:hypothetical protein